MLSITRLELLGRKRDCEPSDIDLVGKPVTSTFENGYPWCLRTQVAV